MEGGKTLSSLWLPKEKEEKINWLTEDNRMINLNQNKEIWRNIENGWKFFEGEVIYILYIM